VSIQGYDQWKTASPYDDEPDPIEEAQRFLEENKDRRQKEQNLDYVCTIIEELLQLI